MQTWKPTHRITFRHHSDRWKDGSWEVMLSDTGAAYTRAEWEANAQADWERDKQWRFWFQGSPAPGLGTVEVQPII